MSQTQLNQPRGGLSPRADTSLRRGHSVDSLVAQMTDSGHFLVARSAPILGQSSMGNGDNNIEGGIIALNSTTAALVLNLGHAYSTLQYLQGSNTTARYL